MEELKVPVYVCRKPHKMLCESGNYIILQKINHVGAQKSPLFFNFAVS